MSGASGTGRVALVTGGSKGVGQGIAVGLAEAGWTVHVSGRDEARLAGTVARVHAAGGQGRAWRCEHTDDGAVAALVRGVAAASGSLDLLVNNAWAGPRMDHARPARLWERPLSDWDSLIGIGLRAHFVALHAAAPLMIEQGSGLVVNISSVGARAYLHSTLYGMSKAALDKMTLDAALELRPLGVSVLSLWPGLVRTEQLLASGVQDIAGVAVSDAETPELQGRVLAALAADPDLHARTGQAVITAELAQEYAVAEPDGGRPVSPRGMFGGGPVFGPLPPA
ncbi:3-oxoacyl-[acyl-carrier-protein] reductase FabG [Nocardioides dokdonensis FR1436]|uniref:3-oxoacyl-[acyl-carrier-protein] reductase FabG n=1 Tax=Nocardioides dokdonensis FR1436 TaxID=1300347 RepID=A0A1A9GGA8_9ACTN|nr:SDR family NAD(P)-dependent oxidoreductase [Nocardioides dokdonensis]ANH37308.1 3-oxoacyl-[acyl-carrier-protein] reductase FabG [Nocardioides dokdonensis FR1436]